MTVSDKGNEMNGINLNMLIPVYRRNSDDVTGAVRMISIDLVSMEQMPGGRFQITARTGGGTDFYLTPNINNINTAREALEAYRSRLSGEVPMYPIQNFVPGAESLAAVDNHSEARQAS